MEVLEIFFKMFFGTLGVLSALIIFILVIGLTNKERRFY